MTFKCVPMEGLEPPHLTASDPKSDVSTNFTTWAFKGCKSNGFDGRKHPLIQNEIEKGY